MMLHMAAYNNCLPLRTYMQNLKSKKTKTKTPYTGTTII